MVNTKKTHLKLRIYKDESTNINQKPNNYEQDISDNDENDKQHGNKGKIKRTNLKTNIWKGTH